MLEHVGSSSLQAEAYEMVMWKITLLRGKQTCSFDRLKVSFVYLEIGMPFTHTKVPDHSCFWQVSSDLICLRHRKNYQGIIWLCMAETSRQFG